MSKHHRKLQQTHSEGRVFKSGLIKRDYFNICVFCASSDGGDAVVRSEAESFGKTLALKGMGLVYGGAKVGLMGLFADTVMSNAGKVHGVIPQALVQKEVAHKGLTELRIVNTMHERKKIMFDLTDLFVSFPGGFGTMDETFEIITWKQIGLHTKPLILMNINGFYDPLIKFIDQAVERGFINKMHRGLFWTANNAAEAWKLIEDYQGKLSLVD